jgi:O-antigen ligase
LTLAHVLLFPFCWAVSLLMEPFNARRRILLALVAACTAVGMFFTYTRATLLIATVASLALVAWGLRVGWKKKLVAGLAVLCLCAGAIGLAPQLREKLMRSFLGSRDWGRLTLWQTALDLASANPLSGVGWGNFHRDAQQRVEEQVLALKAKRFSAKLDWAHSNLLTFLAETGLVGAFAFCLLFVLYFRACASRLRKTPRESLFLRGFMRGAMISIAAFLAAGCFHDTMIHAEGVFCCWFAMGASLAAGGFAFEAEGAG